MVLAVELDLARFPAHASVVSKTPQAQKPLGPVDTGQLQRSFSKVGEQAILLIRTLEQIDLACPETSAVVALQRIVLFGQGFSEPSGVLTFFGPFLSNVRPGSLG